MDKIIVYIAHPISGNVKGNLSDLSRIIRDINLFDNTVVPCAPYYADIVSLKDSVPLERKRGMDNNEKLIRSGVFKQLWLTGDKISLGMEYEIKLFVSLGIPVLNFIGKL